MESSAKTKPVCFPFNSYPSMSSHCIRLRLAHSHITHCRTYISRPLINSSWNPTLEQILYSLDLIHGLACCAFALETSLVHRLVTKAHGRPPAGGYITMNDYTGDNRASGPILACRPFAAMIPPERPGPAMSLPATDRVTAGAILSAARLSGLASGLALAVRPAGSAEVSSAQGWVPE